LILRLVDAFEKAWIIVSPIGHQGMLFGRGNQQISPSIIERVGKDHILVVCTPAKLRGIEGGHDCFLLEHCQSLCMRHLH